MSIQRTVFEQTAESSPVPAVDLRDRWGGAEVRPGGVEVVLAPVSVGVGHSLVLALLVALAVCAQIAYRFRGRDVLLTSEYFGAGIPLADFMKTQSSYGRAPRAVRTLVPHPSRPLSKEKPA